MELFVCDLCNCIDIVELAYPSDSLPHTPNKEWHCTKCQTGEWHELFAYEEYYSKLDYVVNRPNGLGLE
jgi:hypothetical protein